MSNLPQIFQRRHTTSLRKPQKQGGIFSLHLHEKSIQHQYWSRRTSTAFTKQTIPKTACKTATSTGRKNYMSARSSVALIQDEILNSQQQQENNYCQIQCLNQNMMLSAIKLNINTEHIKSQINQISEQERQLKKQLLKMRAQYQGQIQQIQRKCYGYIKDLRQLLSACRRETGMQIKVSKGQLNNLVQDLTDIRQIQKQSDKKIQKMCQQVKGKQIQ